MPNRIPPSKISHTLPFRVRDLESIMVEVDNLDDISLSEEIIEGETQVRLWAETGHWPEGLALEDLIAPHLPVDEVAVVVDTSIKSAACVDFSLMAIDSDGETTHSSLNDAADNLRVMAREFNSPTGKAYLAEPEELDASAEADARMTDTLD